jgi:hypothetical protein
MNVTLVSLHHLKRYLWPIYVTRLLKTNNNQAMTTTYWPTVPHPLPSFPELERGVDRVLSTINSLNDNMEHVFVTLQAMDPDMVKCTTNDHNRFAVEHELMNIKQALSRVHAVYSGLIEIKDNSVVTNSQE